MNKTGDCVTLCSDVKCGYGVCKESGNNGFWCQCDYGYSGENCITRAKTVNCFRVQNKNDYCNYD